MLVPPRDGEGAPPGSDDELLAKVIPLRRRAGDPPAPRILADEPRDVPGGLEDPSSGGDWSIWDPTAAEPNRRGSELRVLADEPGGAPDPPVPGEWSIWDSPPPPLRRAGAADARTAGARPDRPHVLGWRHPRRLIGAAATATIIVVTSLALALGALKEGPGQTSLRAGPGLHASGPSSALLAKRSASQRRSSRAGGAGSHRRPPGRRKARASRTAPVVTSPSGGGGVSVTVRYIAPTVQAPTHTATSAPAAESTPAPHEYSASASANREFGFEH
jgi:hypothetical protein